jgi:transposase-like protein
VFIIARKKSATKQEFISKIKMFCPKCKQETYVIIDDYKLNKVQDGVIFIHKCLNCKEKFNVERKYADL